MKMPSAGRWQRGELVSVICWKNIWEKMEKPVALQAMPGEGVGRSQDSYGGSTLPSLPSGSWNKYLELVIQLRPALTWLHPPVTPARLEQITPDLSPT